MSIAIGGYFDRHPTRWLDATGPRRHDVVAVYFSGDMGLAVGLGEGALTVLRRRGVRVLGGSFAADVIDTGLGAMPGSPRSGRAGSLQSAPSSG